MSRMFEGRVALVTGGASGIGEASVRAFAAEGAAVAVADLSADAGGALVEELRAQGATAEFYCVDATQEAQLAELARSLEARFGRLDFAHNNVGAGHPSLTIESQSLESWDWTIDVCLKSAWLSIKHELPLLRAAGGGSIVNTASMAGVIYTPAASPAYSAAKAGVIHLTVYAAAAYAHEGIRVNSVSPGLTATPLIASMLSQDHQRAIASEHQLIARAVQPEEIAAAVIYLCSPGAAMVTGENLQVAGGRK